MAVTIRLSRHGAKKQAFYRIVVASTRSPRDGRYIEQLGTYDPKPTPARVLVKREKLEKWLAVGARPSDTVSHLLRAAGMPHRRSATAPATDAAPPTEPAAEPTAG